LHRIIDAARRRATQPTSKQAASSNDHTAGDTIRYDTIRYSTHPSHFCNTHPNDPIPFAAHCTAIVAGCGVVAPLHCLVEGTAVVSQRSQAEGIFSSFEKRQQYN